MTRLNLTLGLLAAIVLVYASDAHVFAAPMPPAAGRVLWLAADTNVTTSLGNVTAWDDAGTNAAWVQTVRSDPALTTALFPLGTRSVVRFDGNDGFDLLNDSSLYLDPISIYVVASIDAGELSAIILANYRDPSVGFAVGISDSTAQRLKWFTASPAHSFEPTPVGDLTAELNYLITTSNNGTAKLLRVQDETGSASSTGTGSGLTYPGGPLPELGLGVLSVQNTQFLNGDIAEILVYSGVSAAQDAAVEAYLLNRYFVAAVPEPSTFVLLGLGAIGLAIKARRRRTVH